MVKSSRSRTERARESAERAAYVAVGAPTAALKTLSARVSDLRDTVRASRREMSSDLAREIDEWIAEGEQVIGRAIEKVRDSDITKQVRASARSTGEGARHVVRRATGAAQSGLEVVEPDEALTMINGIGPGYARQLGQAGVVGISSLLDRTATEDEIAETARASGISEGMLESWRGQVDLGRVEGIGESYQHLLHRGGIWTIDQLAAATTSDLVDSLQDVAMPDSTGQRPSRSTIERWSADARKLAPT